MRVRTQRQGVGGSDETSPEPFDATINSATVGVLGTESDTKGQPLVCPGIDMDENLSFSHSGRDAPQGLVRQ